MEETFYDTSILMDLFKKGKTKLVGYTSIFNILEFPKAIRFIGLKVIYPTRRDYDGALKYSLKLLKLGKPIPALDLLIASICFDRGLTLDTKDKHFLSIRNVEKGFKVRVEKR